MSTEGLLKINLFSPKEPIDHVVHLAALAKGYPGAQVLPIEAGYADCDIAVIFGVGKRAVPSSYPRGAIVFDHLLRAKKPLVVLERGFVKRDEYYGVALNGLNGLGYFGPKGNPSDRWDALGVEIKPWKSGGDYILVCGQVPWDASVQHTDHVQWCQDTVATIQSRTDIPVRFRPHPETADFDYGLEPSAASFDEDVANAHAIVSFSSTSAALAVLEGVPIFTMDRGSIAWDVGNHVLAKELLEHPHKPEREPWAHDLAYSQWTVAEMEAGLPWGRIL
jgi:hypothetical protein